MVLDSILTLIKIKNKQIIKTKIFINQNILMILTHEPVEFHRRNRNFLNPCDTFPFKLPKKQSRVLVCDIIIWFQKQTYFVVLDVFNVIFFLNLINGIVSHHLCSCHAFVSLVSF